MFPIPVIIKVSSSFKQTGLNTTYIKINMNAKRKKSYSGFHFLPIDPGTLSLSEYYLL